MPFIPLKTTLPGTTFLPTQAGFAVSTLADMPRDHTGVTLFEPALHNADIIKTGKGKIVLFLDNTCLLVHQNRLYPCPYLTEKKPKEKDINAAIDFLFPAPVESTLTPTGWLPGLVPAFKPFCITLTKHQEILLKTAGEAILYSLYQTHPFAAQCDLVWMSQPIDPQGLVAPHRAVLAPKFSGNAPMPLLTTLKTEAAILSVRLSKHLPPMPGHNLLDGRQDRVALLRVKAPPMQSAHERLDLEGNPFTPLLLMHQKATDSSF